MDHLRANLAQSVEQLIRNEQVIGSNPMIGSIFLPIQRTLTQLIAPLRTKFPVISRASAGETAAQECIFYVPALFLRQSHHPSRALDGHPAS